MTGETTSELDVLKSVYEAMRILRMNTIEAKAKAEKKKRVRKLRLSDKTKALWAKNPDYREKVLTALNSSKVKRKRIEGLKRHYVEHPEDRERQGEIIKAAYRKNPDIRRNMSEKMVEWWSNPENRQKQYRIKKGNSEHMKKLWANPEWKRRITAAMDAARLRRKKLR